MTLPNIYGGAFLEKKLTAKSYYYFRKKALPYMLFSVLNVPLRNLCEKNNKQTNKELAQCFVLEIFKST